MDIIKTCLKQFQFNIDLLIIKPNVRLQYNMQDFNALTTTLKKSMFYKESLDGD